MGHGLQTDAAGPGDHGSVLPVSRDFGPFVVACDNGPRCEVVGIDDGGFRLLLRLSRDAGARGAQALALVRPEGAIDPHRPAP